MSSTSQPKDTTETESLPPHLDPQTYPRTLTTAHGPNQSPIHLELTYTPLSPTTALSTISSPSNGANVLFLGTTRDTFEDRPVAQLSYTSYPALALKSLNRIATDAVGEFGLGAVYIAHRLGVVPVGEASIIVAVGAGHRGETWRGAEKVLEVVKERVEIWKREEFVDGGMEWRENRERDSSGRKKGEAT
ncbi:molybdopterin synthase catalytic subunit [Aspergillus puulaauensis]|uniref:Molybdopterin synthase catalytic subunit n=1 Tax=Aspergillus puulaauensis TaxID=1220207 RepID=A0A7R8ALK2_9EURO|nr:molybdopterin synthase catalytic subunit [Aspergillus puulaauensis]BCS22812.1 molybdopterin synthase catalytic subunit [Aspergillus puulaauensis]